jgi:hypothetical protein
LFEEVVMTRRVSPSQLKSIIRQAEAQQRRDVNRYNAAVRQYNLALRRAVDEHNAGVRRTQRAVNDYNRAARTHNARLRSEIARLDSHRSSTRYVATQTSTVALHSAFHRVEDAAEAGPWDDRSQVLVDLAEGEAANSARMTNTLLGGAAEDDEQEDTSLTDELSSLSEDLDHRWRGALFALNPRNPDAARHFCTSSREVIVQMIDLKAPDDVVLRARPNCRKVKGRPARRDKIGYLLERYGANHESLGDFVEADVDDVMNLFRVFNDGTHGGAGRFDIPSLRAIKGRVEGSVRFLSTVIQGI